MHSETAMQFLKFSGAEVNRVGALPLTGGDLWISPVTGNAADQVGIGVGLAMSMLPRVMIN